MTHRRIFGEYNVIKQIAQGALGAVFLAEHRYMKKQFALKVLPEELATNRAFIQRFEDGIGPLADLDHPNIVKIHNISYSDGTYFLVMDCIVDPMGETTHLGQYLSTRKQPIDEEEAWGILHQVASALDYAHSYRGIEGGIAHQRLKPGNILIGSDKKKPEVLLADFGLAGIVGQGLLLSRTYKAISESIGVLPAELAKNAATLRYTDFSEEPQATSRLHETFLQHYLYLAPEQKRLKDTEKADLMVDSYAFGVLAYYILMRDYPEGVFEMPSKSYPQYKKNWDLLIWNCLQRNPQRRTKSLAEAMEQMQQQKGMMPFSHASSSKPFLGERKPLSQITLPIPEPAQPVEANTALREPAMSAATSEKMTVESKGSASASGLKLVINKPELQRPVYENNPGAIFTEELTVSTYTPKPVEIKEVRPLQTDMVIIPGGSYHRGSNDGNRDEAPRHEVFLSPFALDIHPVTNEQFIRFLEALGGLKDGNNNDVISLRDSRVRHARGKFSIESGYGKHPVVGVTWYGAVAYAKWLGKRLPSEAEWEVAARGGLEDMPFPTGKAIEKNQSNFFSSDTTSVMSYAPNGYGLYDMAGNVYEWCQDWYGYNYYETSAQEPENPSGPLQGVYRVLRGGCWKSLKEDLSSSRRHRNNPGTANGTYGFRCATDVEE